MATFAAETTEGLPDGVGPATSRGLVRGDLRSPPNRREQETRAERIMFAFLDQVGGGFFSQLRTAIRVNPQSSFISFRSFLSGGAQPKYVS